jgi:plastocyanin
MKKILLSFFLIIPSIVVLGTSWEITNDGFLFSPSTITITLGDDVVFSLSSEHNAVEVSQSTWNNNGSTPLAGGFSVNFGGGPVSSSQLGVGTHYYVCSPHASGGMKGVIIVEVATDISTIKNRVGISIFPNPTKDIITIKGNSDLIGLQYRIFDQLGRLVLENTLHSELTPVDISKLHSGVYFVEIIGVKRKGLKLIKI